MINWYKPSEKIPKVKDDVIVLSPDGMSMYRDLVNMVSEEIFIIGISRERLIQCGSYCHWAYASEFNFPKEKE